MAVVEEAIVLWESYRTGLISELENIPEDRMDYRPGDGARTARELVIHVAEAGLFFADQLLKPDGNFMAFFKPDVQAAIKASVRAAHAKGELVALLKSSGADTFARVRTAGEALVAQAMPSRGGTQSRLTALGFAASHESYHRGQLAAYERGMGKVPALTLQMNAMFAKQALTS